MHRLFLGLMVVALTLVSCVFEAHEDISENLSKATNNPVKKDKTIIEKKPNELVSPNFGNLPSYSDPHFNINAPVYTIEPSFKNVINYKRFKLPASTQKLLLKNGFVIYPAREMEYFVIYESNLYDSVPSFVTTDSILHSYHLVFNNLLYDVEKNKLYEICKKMTATLLKLSLDQYNLCKTTRWNDSAQVNVAYAAVAARLLDDKLVVPDFVKPIVEQELALINEHKTVDESPLLGVKEDYTQYTPRSHYAQNPKLERYFKALTWLGRINFSLKKQQTAKSAILLTLALNDNAVKTSFNTIDTIVKFWVGDSDNITFYDIYKALLETYGEVPTIEDLINDDNKYQELTLRLKELPPSKIVSYGPSGRRKNSKATDQDIVFCVLGQRYTIDADIMQRLVYSEVQANLVGSYRLLPSGLDVAAVFGSQTAQKILEVRGDTQFTGYLQNQSKMKAYVKSLDTNYWTKNLYNAWLFSINQLLEPPDAKYPLFMRSAAWELKELNTYLCSWAELKHDTQLYAKPVVAEAGFDEHWDTRGYVEPNPILYSRLLYLVDLTESGLKQRGVVTPKTSTVLGLLRETLSQLKTISIKELNGLKLSAAEHETIKFYGGVLSNIWIKSLEDNEYATVIDLNNTNAATIADIANSPDGQTLQVGNGLLDLILVVVPVEGSLRIAVGGVGSYYEFPQPISQRLTDQAWRKLILAGKEPKRPAWINPIIDTKVKIKRLSSKDSNATFAPPDIYNEIQN